MKSINDLYNIIGSNIKTLRTKKLGLTQEQLAEQLCMSRSFISHIESKSNNKSISLDTLFYISQKYSIYIRDFFINNHSN